MITVTRSVNFGRGATGLSTVGYTLYNSDGTTKQARTISGIAEIGSTGIYKAVISFDDNWDGIIVWDTGGASVRYAQEDFNYLQFGGASGYGIINAGDNIWSKEEKEKVLSLLKKLTKAININAKESIAVVRETINGVIKNIEDLPKPDNKEMLEKLKELKESLSKISIKDDIEKVNKGINIIAQGLCAVMDNQEIEKITSEVSDVVKAIAG